MQWRTIGGKRTHAASYSAFYPPHLSPSLLFSSVLANSERIKVWREKIVPFSQIFLNVSDGKHPDAQSQAATVELRVCSCPMTSDHNENIHYEISPSREAEQHRQLQLIKNWWGELRVLLSSVRCWLITSLMAVVIKQKGRLSHGGNKSVCDWL